MSANNEGREAWRNGLQMEHNPHREGSAMAIKWDRDYMAAHQGGLTADKHERAKKA